MWSSSNVDKASRATEMIDTTKPGYFAVGEAKRPPGGPKFKTLADAMRYACRVRDELIRQRRTSFASTAEMLAHVPPDPDEVEHDRR